MAQIDLPPQKRWTGPYLGEYEGTLWRTFNVDLENNPGNITLSRSFSSVTDTTTATNLGVIDAFIRTNASNVDRWWGVSRNGRLFRTDSDSSTFPTTTWNQDSLDSTPTDAKDFTVHERDSDSYAGEDQLFVTRDSTIAVLNDLATNVWNGNWWVTTKGHGGSDCALKTGVPHPIEYFPLVRTTLVGDANFIHTIDKSDCTTPRRLTLPPYYQVESIFTTAYRTWILCSGLRGMNGAIVEWDGSSTTYNRIYDAQSIYPLAGVNYNDIPIVVNNRGMILEFDANGFSQMVRGGQKISFPFYGEGSNAFVVNTSKLPIAPRGMTVTDDGLIFINVKEPGLASHRQMGGIWCLNPFTGNFYSKHSLSNGGDTDFGNQIIDAPGAIKLINASASGLTNDAYLLAGGRVESSVGTTFSRIWAFNRAYGGSTRKGYFITQYLHSDSIQEMWDAIWVKFSAFKSSNDRIIIKARGVNPLVDVNKRPLQATCTWTGATTFTVTLDSGDDTLVVGDEIETLTGRNTGQLAHITVISGSHGALQTITIDESFTATSGTSTIRFDRWKKLGVINNTTKYFTPLNVGISSSFIQFKIELRGPSVDFNIQSLIAYLKTQTSTTK